MNDFKNSWEAEEFVNPWNVGGGLSVLDREEESGNITNDNPVKLKTKGFTEGSVIYFVFVSPEPLRKEIIEAGNYIINLNRVNAKVVGIDYSHGKTPIQSPYKSSRIVYIGNRDRRQAMNIEVPAGQDIKELFGFTPNVPIKEAKGSFVFTESFNQLGLSEQPTTNKYFARSDSDVQIDLDFIEHPFDKNQTLVSKYGNKYKSRNKVGAYDRATLIARTAIHEMTHQLFSTPKHSDLYSDTHYDYDLIMSYNNKTPDLNVLSHLVNIGLLKYEKNRLRDADNIMIGGGKNKLRFPKEMNNGSSLKYLAVDLFFTRHFFKYALDYLDITQALNNASDNTILQGYYKLIANSYEVKITDNLSSSYIRV